MFSVDEPNNEGRWVGTVRLVAKLAGRDFAKKIQILYRKFAFECY
jgi:hypothetical protein